MSGINRDHSGWQASDSEKREPPPARRQARTRIMIPNGVSGVTSDCHCRVGGVGLPAATHAAAAADSDPGLTVTVTRRAMMTRMERPAVAKRIRSLFT